jgi:hypothetical protein
MSRDFAGGSLEMNFPRQPTLLLISCQFCASHPSYFVAQFLPLLLIQLGLLLPHHDQQMNYTFVDTIWTRNSFKNAHLFVANSTSFIKNDLGMVLSFPPQFRQVWRLNSHTANFVLTWKL